MAKGAGRNFVTTTGFDGLTIGKFGVVFLINHGLCFTAYDQGMGIARK